jgi:hypothetical protein
VKSALVVAEVHGWFLRRYDARRATEFLSFLDALPAFTVVPLIERNWQSSGRSCHGSAIRI